MSLRKSEKEKKPKRNQLLFWYLLACVFLYVQVCVRTSSVTIGVWPLDSRSLLGRAAAAGVDAASVQSVARTI